MSRKLAIHARLPEGRDVKVSGREAETLLTLISAGPHGFTSLEGFRAGWAVRLSAYIHDLRRLGVPIETTREPHDGGQHARYHLAVPVEVVWRNDRRDAA